MKALLGARAFRVAGRPGSRLRYGIDHGEALLQWRLAQEEPVQGAGQALPPTALKRASMHFRSGIPAILQRVARFDSNKDGFTQEELVRVPV